MVYCYKYERCVIDSVKPEEIKKIKELQKSLGDKYDVYYLVDEDPDNDNDKAFVYDKRTLSHNVMELRGPYEIRNADNETKVIKNKKLNKCFKNEILEMKHRFDRDCDYVTVMTTMYVSITYNV